MDASRDYEDLLHPVLASLLQRRALLKDRFNITEFIDQGGFASVFKCLDTKGTKEVRGCALLPAPSDAALLK